MQNNIQQYRTRAGLSQSALGEAIGASGQGTISNYERGYRTPDINDCRAILVALRGAGLDELTLDELFPAEDCA